MNTPLVSIITTTWRSQRQQLQAALHSAVRQTYRHLEIIVSDDSPEPDLADMVSGMYDERLHYRHNVPALGVAANHARCIAEARGDFIVILNHDDWLDATFVERLLQPLLNDASLALAFCDHWIVDVDGERRVAETEAASARYGRAALALGRHRPFHQLLVDQTIPLAMGTLFRRSALSDLLPVNAGPAYDLWLTYLLCRNGQGAWYVPARLSNWRTHAGNQTSLGSIELLAGAADCWAAIAADDRLASVRQAAAVRAELAYRACACWQLRHGNGCETRRYALQALRYRVSPKSLAVYAAGLLPAGLLRS